jgi:hypothetical protein
MRKKSGKSHNKGSGKKKQTTTMGGAKGGSVETGQGSPRPVRKGKGK